MKFIYEYIITSKSNGDTFWVALGSLSTLAAVIYALYKDFIREKYLSPKLKYKRISVKNAIIEHNGSASTWNRVAIKNEGLTTAKRARILLEAVSLKGKQIDPEFNPIPLNWVGYLGQENRDIARGETVLFDLFYRVPSDNEIHFQYGNPTLQGNFNHLPVGLYVFQLSLYSDNADPTSLSFKIKKFGKEFDYTDLVKI